MDGDNQVEKANKINSCKSPLLRPQLNARSQSLLELTPSKKDQSRYKEWIDNDATTTLAWKGYVAFMYNLCRKRALAIKAHQKDKTNLLQKTHQLNVQIISLKSLLKSADQLVMKWAKEMNEVRRKLGQVEAFNIQLTEETSLMAEKIVHMTDSVESCQAMIKNLKNSEQQLQSDNVNLELQLEMEREKVSALRKEKSLLEEKVEMLSGQFKEKLKHIDELGLSVVNLKNLIDSQRELIIQAEEKKDQDSRLLKSTGKELEQVNKEVSCLTKLNKHLKDESSQLKKQLVDMEHKYQLLEAFYDVEEQSKKKWKNQLKQTATSLAQMSLYVLNSVAFPSVTSNQM